MSRGRKWIEQAGAYNAHEHDSHDIEELGSALDDEFARVANETTDRAVRRVESAIVRSVGEYSYCPDCGAFAKPRELVHHEVCVVSLVRDSSVKP